MSRRPPAASLRRGTLLAASGALALAFAGGLAAERWLGVSPRYALVAAALVLPGMSIALLLVDRHHPYPRFGPANTVTTARAAMVALLVALVVQPATPALAAAATAASALVAALDAVDGWLARRTGMASPFGARFDVETDSIFILALSILLWRHGKTGAWVLAGGLYRYAFVAAGWLLPWMAQPLRPTNRARAVAACHMLGLTVALAPIVPGSIAAAGVAATLAALTWSFAIDVGRLWRGDSR